MVRLRSFRFQLLTAVNAAIVFLLGVFLVIDYRTEIDRRVVEKHAALEEEVDTLLPAIRQMQPLGAAAVQRYIDDVCGRMRDTVSPGHHIAVESDGQALQAVAHHRASPEIFAAMRRAADSPTHQAGFGDERLLAASRRYGNTAVYASEYVTHIRRAANRRAFQRALRIVWLALATGVVVNVVFARLANKPLQQLVETVWQIEQGRLGIQTGPFRSEEFGYLAQAVNSMSSSLAEAERRRREEMARARGIQQQLLPQDVEAPGLQFATLYCPADDVAGDYYDILPLRDGTWLVCIADVDWRTHAVPIRLGDRLLLATDGATEAMNEREELFGRPKLSETWEAARHLPLDEAVAHLGRILEQYSGDRRATDDLTLLAMEVVQEPATGQRSGASSANRES
jgi:phosphoserine phosphatase RsbU/P